MAARSSASPSPAPSTPPRGVLGGHAGVGRRWGARSSPIAEARSFRTRTLCGGRKVGAAAIRLTTPRPCRRGGGQHTLILGHSSAKSVAFFCPRVGLGRDARST
eukprot:28300-Pyramimonas_sp.AAC.1